MTLTYHAYKGYFRKGRFVSPEAASIPENSMVYVMVVGEEADTKLFASDDERQAHRAAFDEFFAAIAEIEDEPITDEDLANLARHRVNFRREFTL